VSEYFASRNYGTDGRDRVRMRCGGCGHEGCGEQHCCGDGLYAQTLAVLPVNHLNAVSCGCRGRAPQRRQSERTPARLLQPLKQFRSILFIRRCSVGEASCSATQQVGSTGRRRPCDPIERSRRVSLRDCCKAAEAAHRGALSLLTLVGDKSVRILSWAQTLDTQHRR
jgi:hypothetical protein